MTKKLVLTLICALALQVANAQQPQRRGHRPYFRPMAYTTDTMMAHDPVMAYERGTYYLFATGNGISWATSKDRKTWTVQSTPFIEKIPSWTADSVQGFRTHVWAPDIIKWHGRWWLTYSCSAFGKNTSAIGVMSSERLNGQWKDEGCIVRSVPKRDDWNAIDSNIAIDDNDNPWMVWGSFWDGIQIAKLDTTMHLASKPVTVARRHRPGDPNAAENPTSKYAGRNAIEAPFIFKKNGYYYLFVSWDYCCRGAKSNYRVAVGRSKNIAGPYLDRNGKDMANGGGNLFIEGDKKEYEAAGHCAAYTFQENGKDTDVFICHGYSTKQNGMALLVQRPIKWTNDGWPTL